MKPSIALLEIPQGRRGQAKVLKEAARRYPAGYAEPLSWAGKRWLLCAAFMMPAYPKYFHRQFKQQQGLALCAVQQGFFIYGWQEEKILVCSWGQAKEIRVLLTFLAAQENYQPEIWFDTQGQREFSVERLLFPTATQHEWPQLSSKESAAFKMQSIKRLLSLPWLRLFFIGALVLVISFMVSFWHTQQRMLDVLEPELDFATRLTQTKTNLVPLLRLDYNLQLLLSQVVGWRLQAVHYQPQELVYQLVRENGHVADLRQFAQENHFHLATTGTEAVLTRALELPSAIPTAVRMRWHSVAELTDWFEEQLSLWLPTTELKLGGLEQLAREPAVSSEPTHLGQERVWQQQTLILELRDYYLADLLTLAGLLDGLPMQLQRAHLRYQNNLIHGQVMLTAMGALG